MNWDILNISNHPFHNMHMYCIVSFYFLHIFLSLWYLRSYAPVLDHLSMLLRREGLPFIRGLILNLPKYSWARVIKIYPQQHIFYRELKQLPSRLGGFLSLSPPHLRHRFFSDSDWLPTFNRSAMFSSIYYLQQWKTFIFGLALSQTMFLSKLEKQRQ